jgi:hypothetical protein
VSPWLSDRRAKRDEVVATIDELDPAYQQQCADDFAHPSAQRVSNNPDVDFRDAAADQLMIRPARSTTLQPQGDGSGDGASVPRPRACVL